jgi:hypothetical protein
MIQRTTIRGNWLKVQKSNRYRHCSRGLSRHVVVRVREKVAALKKQGKMLAEVIAAKPSAPHNVEWGNPFMNPARFLAFAYQRV